MKYKVCVLTPTYNRRDLIERLYRSLCEQTQDRFQWLVIDDGSTDETEAYIQKLTGHKFELNYYKKENGGKHTAINFAFPYIQGDVVVIVDSDDYLSADAIGTIESDWEKYKNNSEIGCLSYHRWRADQGGFCSKKDDQDVVISDHIAYRVNLNRGGDRCEVIRTDCLKQFPFPTFENEKFMAESWLWNRISEKYRTVYINKAIYVCDYQPGGLTAQGRRLRMNSPRGMMEDTKSYLTQKNASNKIKIKETWLWWVYGLCARMSIKRIVGGSPLPLFTLINAPFGVMLYILWRAKYGRTNN